MFTDIVKSTNLAEAMGDDAWLELLRWHDETLRSTFASHNGEEVGTTGDGFFVVFDGPDAAVTCAVAIQRRLADHRKQHGFAPQVRIGVHASEAAQVEKDFRGKGVHEAARIAALAEGGEIIASRETVGAGSQYPVSEARAVTLKGITEPVEVVTIDWR
jgi:class 3 adenylate cyclase